jgi:bifunctional enzyme CysN/CysC
LRFITAGSVDDGKSTLIGRLLFDSKGIFADQLDAISRAKHKRTSGNTIDLSLLTDGLEAEREQGITIDVAYRYFATPKRKFIIADTPGHEQYTRNMATGASTADLAIILIDARHGVLTQTKRHSFIVSLLGIRHVVVTINKMDLVNYSQARFDEICEDYKQFVSRLDLPDLHFIPLAALHGENVVDPSPNMPWYRGNTLMNFLESVYIGSDRNLEDFRLPIQYVNRPNLDFRGFCGTIASGILRKGDEIMVLPSKRTSKVKRLVTQDGDLDEAFCPQSVTVVLDDEVDCSRGDMIVRPGNVPKSSNQFDATIVWLNADALLPGKTYLFKHTSQTIPGQIDSLRYRVDVNTLHRLPAPELHLNEIGRCSITLSQSIYFDAYKRNRSTGAFIIIDRLTNATVGAGMITDRDTARPKAAWESTEQDTGKTESMTEVNPQERSARFGQSPTTVLFTGLTGTGKSTIARAVERALFDQGRAVMVLDGEKMRSGVNQDLGFSVEDRSENLRRSAHIARIMNDAGLICLAAFVAPSESIRARVAELVGKEKFLVVHLTADEQVRIARDSKGHYAKAQAGVLPNFPGVSAVYEVPEKADLVVDSGKNSIQTCVELVLRLLADRAVFKT